MSTNSFDAQKIVWWAKTGGSSDNTVCQGPQSEHWHAHSSSYECWREQHGNSCTVNVFILQLSGLGVWSQGQPKVWVNEGANSKISLTKTKPSFLALIAYLIRKVPLQVSKYSSSSTKTTETERNGLRYLQRYKYFKRKLVVFFYV